MERRKIAVVTGAGRGIGRAVGEALGEDGYTVVLISRTEAELAEAAREIEKTAGVGTALPIPLDVTDEVAVDRAIAEIVGRFGGVDLLFNNAGIHAFGDVSASPDTFRRVLEVNLVGAYNMTRAVLPSMEKHKRGYIMNLSSICGVHGFAGMGAYTASKFGLMGLNESLFRSLIPNGIRVTAICPSWVNTAMSKHAPFPQAEMIQPADIVRTVRYLLSLGTGAVVREIVVECTKDPLP